MSGQCKFMQAAYPTLDADDTCGWSHEHTDATFALGRALAGMFQQPDPTDEQIAWFLDDAQAVINDWNGSAPTVWEVTELPEPRDFGLDFQFEVNGVHFVVQTAEWEPALPVSLTTWRSWGHEEDDDDDE